MQFTEDQLAGLLQATREFAKDMLEQTGSLVPFGGHIRPDGELEFFAFPPNEEVTSREAIYRQIESSLIERAGKGEILAAVIILDMIVPDTIETAFRNAIGILLETPNFSRFVYATFKLTAPAEQGGKGSVEFGEIIPIEANPSIFV